MAFQEASEEINQNAMKEGKNVYLYLKKSLGENSVDSLDTILNALCFAMVMLIHEKINYDDHINFLQVIYKNLHSNITAMPKCNKYRKPKE